MTFTEDADPYLHLLELNCEQLKAVQLEGMIPVVLSFPQQCIKCSLGKTLSIFEHRLQAGGDSSEVPDSCFPTYNFFMIVVHQKSVKKLLSEAWSCLEKLGRNPALWQGA